MRCGMYIFGLFVGLGLGIGAWKVWGFGPSSTLCAGPSFSKHFGGKGLGGCRSQGCHGYPTHSARFDSVASPSFLGTIPQAYLLLMSLNVAKCNLG